MEQRIDSNTKPEFAAGTDPAFIPGLTAPAPVRTEEAKKGPKESEGEAGVSDAVVEDAVAADQAEAPADATEAVAEDQDGARDPEAGPDGAGEGSGPEDGPVFEVSDRRGSIRVAREGVRFRLDDQEAEFDWSEIGAVEVKTPRLGRRFTVTVHLANRRWFNAEVEAPARARLKEWTAELDAALDAYFEET
ncbi:hypothetical protein [Streptomyces sp. NRRL WC-3549]|uniref:hypothetical protein n=1 Tax=Streptomyces sp. NRRL WC-3549 TaxID=1463925 RepID=UPI0004C548C6|nr:hypothetical protein [Streptomyces sp. NRRL WC-3549]